MKRFSQQFKKKSDTIRMRVSERADLRDRLVAYMEYHPLPQEMRSVPKKKRVAQTLGIPSESFHSISINMQYLRGFAGVFAVFLIVGVPLVAERSVPGDVLYPVKTNLTEEVRASLKLSPYAKVEWETKRLERRLSEARLLATAGKLTPETEAKVTEAVKAHTDAAQQEIAQIREADADEAAIAEIAFASALEVQSEVLEGHIAKADKEGNVSEGTSVVALASVIHEAAEVADGVQGQAVLSYDKLRGRVEAETTHAYELFTSIEGSASENEILDIKRRLSDIERKIAVATAVEEVVEVTVVEAVIEADNNTEATTVVEEEQAEALPASTTDAFATETEVVEEISAQVEVEPVMEDEVIAEQTTEVEQVTALRAVLKDLRKLIAFMTDIDVRENVTIEELVPVTLTDEERLMTARSQYNQARALAEEIVLYEVNDEYAEKVEVGMSELTALLAAAEGAFTENAVVAAESAASEALAVATDIHAIVSGMPKKDIVLPEELVTEPKEATTTLETTEEEIELASTTEVTI